MLRIRCAQVILATGGPAGIYFNRVYPESQFGMSGMAFEAGAAGANLDCWQYGLASVGFRWNVSAATSRPFRDMCPWTPRGWSGSSWPRPWGKGKPCKTLS